MLEIGRPGGERRISLAILRWETASSLLLASCLLVTIVPVLLLASFLLVQALLAGTMSGSGPFLFLVGLAIGGYIAVACMQMLSRLFNKDSRTMYVGPEGVLLPSVGAWAITQNQQRKLDWGIVQRVVRCDTFEELSAAAGSIGGAVLTDESRVPIIDRRRKMRDRDFPVIVVVLNDGKKLAVTRVIGTDASRKALEI